MGMSAAYAAVLTTAAAAAAANDFTLTICFVLFSKRSEGSQEILKRLLTLTLNRNC